MRFKAQHAHIDLNGHVNNVHYIEWMLEATPGTVPGEMEIVFRSETFAGDEVLVESVPGSAPLGTVPMGSTGTVPMVYYRVYAPDGKDHITAYVI